LGIEFSGLKLSAMTLFLIEVFCCFFFKKMLPASLQPFDFIYSLQVGSYGLLKLAEA